MGNYCNACYEQEHGEILEEIHNSDWVHIFREYGGPSQAIWNRSVSQKDVKIEDVCVVLHLVEGEREGPDWVGVFRLKDGRHFTVRAGCDYTGWG